FVAAATAAAFVAAAVAAAFVFAANSRGISITAKPGLVIGALLLQFATLYEVMVGVTCGFLAPQTIIPTASALVLAGALLAPLLIRTVVRER
ncbi:MAG: hypothetical protein AAB562_03720, partial [Patescibacteria group bacterium]